MRVQPYLFLEGRCEEALAFWQQAAGAEIVTLMRFGDAPEGSCAPAGNAGKVMHAAFRIGESEIMASDGMCGGQPRFEGVALSLTLTGKEAAEQAFVALSAGGEVTQPMIETFFSPAFGMLKDRFGVAWLVMAQGG